MCAQVMERVRVLTIVTAIVTMLEVNVSWWYALERMKVIQMFAMDMVVVYLLTHVLVVLRITTLNVMTTTVLESFIARLWYVLVMEAAMHLIVAVAQLDTPEETVRLQSAME